MIVGRNEDYVSASNPTLVATPRGIARTGSEDEAAAERSVKWTTKFGSVAVFADNRFPADGMNEAGLTARTLYYVEGDPNQSLAPDSNRLELDADHWVSFVLDNFQTVSEAVEAIRSDVYLVSVKGRKGYIYATPKHLAMADASGDSAIVEIENGRVRIFHGSQYTILTNPPSYQEQLKNAQRYADVAAADLPSTWNSLDRFVRADYWQRHLPEPHGRSASTAYGFMYAILGNVALPPGLPTPAQDKQIVAKLMEELPDSHESYGVATYYQTITDLTNKHYRFKSVVAPSDVFFDMQGYDFSNGQPVKVVKKIDQYAERGWSGDVVPHLIAITKDIYDEPIE